RSLVRLGGQQLLLLAWRRKRRVGCGRRRYGEVRRDIRYCFRRSRRWGWLLNSIRICSASELCQHNASTCRAERTPTALGTPRVGRKRIVATPLAIAVKPAILAAYPAAVAFQ